MPTAKKKGSAECLALRVIVLDPPPNILWTLQLGQDEMVQPSSATKSRISFDFAVEVIDGRSKGAFTAFVALPFKGVRARALSTYAWEPMLAR